jgi:hypothetical protein
VCEWVRIGRTRVPVASADGVTRLGHYFHEKRQMTKLEMDDAKKTLVFLMQHTTRGPRGKWKGTRISHTFPYFTGPDIHYYYKDNHTIHGHRAA